MTDRELRLRARIDTLTDQRDHARAQLADLRTRLRKRRVAHHAARAQAELWRHRAMTRTPR